jgi:endonuclease/exonuclease/phosphatase family metal-dependent hydrolase
MLLWVLNASSAGHRAEGCPVGCVTASEREEGPLRVMSLNVLHGFPSFDRLSTRLDLVGDEIRRQDADIVCLQEVPRTLQLGSGAAYLARRTGLNHLYGRANGNRWAILFEEGEAILSRYPLRDMVLVELQPRAGFFEHRVVLSATAATPWGDVRVYATHLTHGDPSVNRAQAASLKALVDVTATGPALVAGDLNATEETPQIVALARKWVDVYRTAHPEDEGLTCCVDDLQRGPEGHLRKRIDYIYVVSSGGQEVRVLDARRVLDQPFRVADGWQWASDHVGLLAVLDLE